MDEGAAGTVEQAVNWTHQAIGLGQFDPAKPVRIEQLVIAEGAIIGINDRTGPPFALAAERDLDVVTRSGAARGADQGTGPAPSAAHQLRFFPPNPNRTAVRASLPN